MVYTEYVSVVKVKIPTMYSMGDKAISTSSYFVQILSLIHALFVPPRLS